MITFGLEFSGGFNQWFCIECMSTKKANEVTNDEKCINCGKDVFNNNDILEAFSKSRHGWKMLHDLSDIEGWLHSAEQMKQSREDIAQLEGNLLSWRKK